MWTRLRKLSCSIYNNQEICQMTSNPDNTYARIEYVLRYFTHSWLSPFKADEAKKICDEELLKAPQHAFFNYASAQMETKNVEKRINYLIVASKSRESFDKIINAQAAYETSMLLYPKGDSFTPCLAWLSQAIILGSNVARNDLMRDDLHAVRKFTINSFCVVFLTTYFAGVKIDGLVKSELVKYNLNCDTTPFMQAYDLPMDDNILRADSPIIKILELLISRSQNGFVTYFCYCMQHGIVREQMFVNLIHFYLNSAYTDQHLREQAVKTLVNFNLLSFFQPQPAFPVFYSMPVPSAPLMTTQAVELKGYSAATFPKPY